MISLLAIIKLIYYCWRREKERATVMHLGAKKTASLQIMIISCQQKRRPRDRERRRQQGKGKSGDMKSEDNGMALYYFCGERQRWRRRRRRLNGQAPDERAAAQNLFRNWNGWQQKMKHIRGTLLTSPAIWVVPSAVFNKKWISLNVYLAERSLIP